MHVTLSSEVLSVNSSGTDVVLARFPVEGETLTSFGLTPSIIKTIAIPNDIQEWPTEFFQDIYLEWNSWLITRPQSKERCFIELSRDDVQFSETLKTIQFPSSVRSIIQETFSGVHA